MKRDPKAPWFGAAYYPETWEWDPHVIDEDIRLMQEAGMNAVRMTEFAWSAMEPREGVFTFAPFDAVIDRLAQEGIAVVLGTPSATPPVWLTARYPDMLMENDDGTRKQHGERRHC